VVENEKHSIKIKQSLTYKLTLIAC